MSHNVTDQKEKSRFELDIDGQTVFANYRVEGGTVFINYVESPVVLRGTGAAGKLMEGITAIARERGQKLHPICSYAVMWLQRHKDSHDLLA